MISSDLCNQVLKCGKLLSRKCGDGLSDFIQCSLGGVCVSPTGLLLESCSLFLRTLDIVNWTKTQFRLVASVQATFVPRQLGIFIKP